MWRKYWILDAGCWMLDTGLTVEIFYIKYRASCIRYHFVQGNLVRFKQIGRFDG